MNLGSFCIGEHFHVGGALHLRRNRCSCVQNLPDLALNTSSSGYSFVSFIINWWQWVKCFPSSETVNYQPEVGGHRNLQLVASRQKYRSSGTFIQHLKWEKSCGTEPLTCGVSVNSGVNSRVELNCRIPKRCPESEELVAVGENPHFISEVSVNSAQNTAMG